MKRPYHATSFSSQHKICANRAINIRKVGQHNGDNNNKPGTKLLKKRLIKHKNYNNESGYMLYLCGEHTNFKMKTN